MFEDDLISLGIDYRIFDAVAGKELSEEARNTVYDSEANALFYKRPLTDGEIGCYLSHLGLWREVVATNRTALILEDDFRLHPDTSLFVQGLPAQLAYGSIIKLSHARRQKFAPNAVQELHGRKIRTFQIISPHTTGYVIGPEAAARMLAVRERFFRPVDIDIKHDWEHGVPVYGVDPALVSETAGLKSTIAAEREAAKSGSLLYRFASNSRYQFRFQLDRLRQNMFSKSRNETTPPDDTE